MDVSGQDMTWVPSKGKAPQRVRVKRSIGQEKKYIVHIHYVISPYKRKLMLVTVTQLIAVLGKTSGFTGNLEKM